MEGVGLWRGLTIPCLTWFLLRWKSSSEHLIRHNHLLQFNLKRGGSQLLLCQDYQPSGQHWQLSSASTQPSWDSVGQSSTARPRSLPHQPPSSISMHTDGINSDVYKGCKSALVNHTITTDGKRLQYPKQRGCWCALRVRWDWWTYGLLMDANKCRTVILGPLSCFHLKCCSQNAHMESGPTTEETINLIGDLNYEHLPKLASLQLIDICLFHNNFKINMFFLTCILNIGHVTSKHITYSSHEINKHFFLGFGFKEKGGGWNY